MQRVFAEAGAVLVELQLFAAHFAPQRVVVVAGLLANEKHSFHFLLTLSATFGPGRVECLGLRVEGPKASRSHALPGNGRWRRSATRFRDCMGKLRSAPGGSAIGSGVI